MSLNNVFRSVFAFLLMNVGVAHAQIATLYSSDGIVEVKVASGSWQKVSAGYGLAANDLIRTGARSRAALRFADGYLVRLGQKSQIRVTPKDNEIAVEQGKSYFFSRKPKKFPNVRTSQVSASVRGTEFVVDVSGEQTEISVLDGVVLAANERGQVEVTHGQRAIAKTGQAPVQQIMLDSVDSVQWALYYPAILDVSDFADAMSAASPQQREGFTALSQGEVNQAKALFSGSSWVDTFGLAAASYQDGDAFEALRVLERGDYSNASILLLKTSLLLSLGDVEAATDLLPTIGKAIEKSLDLGWFLICMHKLQC